MSASTLQHYVPRFLLRKFGLGKKDRIHVFDKQEGYSFASSAKKVAAERGLYDFMFMGAELSMEPALSKLETLAAEVIDNIENRRWLPHETSDARVQLACFLAVQLVRTRAQLNARLDIRHRMESWLRSQGMEESYFAPDPAVGSGENAEKALLAREMTFAHKEYAPLLLEKDWLLLQTTRQHPFMIGDSPLAMNNMIDRGGRGNLGLKVEGIELYLPINPQLSLALLCPSHTAELRQGTERYLRLSRLPEVQRRFGDVVVNARHILDAIDGGAPVPSTPENVEFHNSLQVIESERFVFSMSDNFSLVKDMLRTNPELRTGPRMMEATGKF